MSEKKKKYPIKNRYVIDTSVFTNPDSQKLFGINTEGAVTGFIQSIQTNGLEIYMPASIFREFSNFITADVLSEFRKHIIVRAPDLYNIQIPAAMFHAFIRGLRQRVNKGLAIAEKAIRSENIPENVRWVRQQYREALRSGIVDSVEDFEVIILAKEVEAAIVSEDQGIANMAEEFGLEVFSGEQFAYCHIH